MKMKFTPAKFYVAASAVFILTFFLIILSPVFAGSSYNFTEIPLNEYQTLGGNIQVAIASKSYNAEERFMRIGFFIDETTSTSTGLANVTYDIQCRYYANQGVALETELIRINDNFLVGIIHDLPPGFEVLSLTFSGTYIYPELLSSDTLSGKSLKFYIHETDEILNSELEIGTGISYVNEYVDLQQTLCREEISELEEEIRVHQLAISQTESMIASLKENQKYQTESEKTATDRSISSYEKSIQTHESEIESLRKKAAELEEKITLLEARRISE